MSATDDEIRRLERLARYYQNITAHALAQAGIASLGTALGSVGRGGGKGSQAIHSSALDVGARGGK